MFIAGKWWALIIRGIAAVIFGLSALLLPGITLGVLVVLFAAYALVDGIFAIVAAVSGAGRGGNWGEMLLLGILGIIASVVAMTYPAMTAVALLYVIAIWAVVTGFVEIWSAARLRRVITGEWKLVVSGIISVLFGIALLAFPGPGLLAVLWIIGAYGLIFGAMMIATGITLRIREREDRPALGERAA
jgi:uncharacterized membrane protein HdeD (DUF308 family)